MLGVFPLSRIFLGLGKWWDRRSSGEGDLEILTHSDPPDNRTLVFPTAGEVFPVVAPFDVPHLIGVYFQNCKGASLRNHHR